jgi:hypothetical protein
MGEEGVRTDLRTPRRSIPPKESQFVLRLKRQLKPRYSDIRLKKKLQQINYI